MACSESDLLYYLDKSEAKSFIKLAGVRLFPSGYTYGPHKHDDIEIVCVDSGVCIIKFVNENKDVYVNKGEGIIIYPEVNHKFIIDDKAKCRITQIQFALSDLDYVEELSKSYEFINSIYSKKQYEVIDSCLEVKGCINRINNNMQSRTLIMLYIVELVVHLSNSLSKVHHDTVQDKKLQSIIEYINMHLSVKIVIEKMCDEFGISSRYLRKKFKEAFGVNVNHYITIQRINLAKKLLADRSLSVVKVAGEAGFSSSQYFSHVFKKMVGVTPTEYRINHYRSKTSF
ncbi:MAG: AraC family transcriptional regulator [Clostridiaceae bacterium]|nr:AraC family transcriptional regulator [Clostridiaceae bacterium]